MSILEEIGKAEGAVKVVCHLLVAAMFGLLLYKTYRRIFPAGVEKKPIDNLSKQ